MKQRGLFFLLFILFTNVIGAQMVVREADSLMRHYTNKASTFLVADSSLKNYFTIDLFGVSMFASPEDKKNGTAEYKVTWQQLPIYKNMMAHESREESMSVMKAKGGQAFSSDIVKLYGENHPAETNNFHPPLKPLAGMRIALDPGHIANDTVLGRTEEKFIHMKIPFGKDSTEVGFAEGELTWQTAYMLAFRLRNAGAEVMITRSGSGMTAFGKTFSQWKVDDYPRTLDSLLKAEPDNQNLKDLKSGKLIGDRAIFRFVFRDAELRKRAEKINAFQPDITVIIHFNVDESNSPWTTPSPRNFNMLFVPGAFQAGELSDPEKRFDFLRLLLTDDIEQSILACGKTGEKMKTNLKVKLAGSTDATYLAKSCLGTPEDGVYCRNLGMTRLVQSSIIFGETLYQDNSIEAVALNDMSYADKVSGLKTAKRLVQVADAYYEGILDYVMAK